MAYPPPPQDGDYEGLPRVEERDVPKDDQSRKVVAHVRFDGDDQDGEQRQPVVVPPKIEFGVNRVWVTAEGRRSRSFNDGKTSRAGDAPSQEASPKVVEDLCFAPTQDEGSLEVGFEVHHPEHVKGAKLELFCRGHREPIWTRAWGTRWAKGGDAIDAFTGLLEEDEDGRHIGKTPWAVEVSKTLEVADEVAFPDGHLTVGRSPYQLRLTVTARESEDDDAAKDKYAFPGVAWTYAHVLVHELTLEWGPKQAIPAERGDDPVSEEWAPKTLAWEKELVDGLAQQKTEAGAVAADGEGGKYAVHKVLLKSDCFASTQNQDTHDAHYRAYRRVWGHGPRIPLVAKAKVRDVKGAAADVPGALHGAEFVWDWDDGDWAKGGGQPDKVARWTTSEAELSKKILKEALDCLVAVDTKKGDAPAGSTNCHVHHGGKRGAGAPPIFPPQSGEGYERDTGAIQEGKFPCPVRAAGQRKWAAISQARSKGVLAGGTAALFQPSRMAGDTYQVRVYPLVAGFPWDKSRADLEADFADLPSAKTGIFEVWRKVQAKVYQKDTSVNFDKEYVRKAFFAAGIDLVLPDGAPVPAAKWKEALDAAMADRGGEVWFRGWGPLFVADQQDGVYVMTLADKAAAEQKAKQHTSSWELIVSGTDPFSVPVSAKVKGGVVLHKFASEAHVAIVLSDAGDAFKAGDTFELNGKTCKVVTANKLDADGTWERLKPVVDGYRESDAYNFAKNLCDFTQAKFLAANHADEPGAYMFVYKDMVAGRTAGKPVSGGASSKTANEVYAGAEAGDQCNIYVSRNADLPGLDQVKEFADVITHEFGHSFFLPHMKPETGNNRVHDHSDEAVPKHCVMNYERESKRFCALCILRMRGWPAYGSKDAKNPPEVKAQLRPLLNEQGKNSISFALHAIDVTVQATPPRTVRHLFSKTTTNVPQPSRFSAPAPNEGVDLAANGPLVLLTNTLATDGAALDLEAALDLPDGAKPVWKVVRAADDHPNVAAAARSALPTLTVDGTNPSRAKLKTNAAGTFHVKVSIDPTGGAAFDDAAQFGCLNLVLVNAKNLGSEHTVTSKHCGVSKVTAGGLNDIMLHTQKATREGFDYGDRVPLHLKTRVHLIGGGPDGKRGLEKVFGGWVNNISLDRSGAIYKDTRKQGRDGRGSLFHLNRTANSTWEALQPALSRSAPVVDSRGAIQLSQWGGGAACLSTSRPQEPASAGAAHGSGVGVELLYEVLDAPMTAWDRFYPGSPGKEVRIDHIAMYTDFHAFLCFWTHNAQAPTFAPEGGDDPGCRTYGVLESVDWAVAGEYDVDADKKTKTVRKLSVTETGGSTHKDLVSARMAGVELYPPGGKQVCKPRKVDGTDFGAPWTA